MVTAVNPVNDSMNDRGASRRIVLIPPHGVLVVACTTAACAARSYDGLMLLPMP